MKPLVALGACVEASLHFTEVVQQCLQVQAGNPGDFCTAETVGIRPITFQGTAAAAALLDLKLALLFSFTRPNFCTLCQSFADLCTSRHGKAGLVSVTASTCAKACKQDLQVRPSSPLLVTVLHLCCYECCHGYCQQSEKQSHAVVAV